MVGIYISGHPLDDFKAEIKSFCNSGLSAVHHMEQYVNKELSIAGGVITDVQHRVSKNGKGWAMFSMEDYTDSYDFRIFGEEYLKFRHFLMISSFVYVKIYIREGWTNKDTGKKGEPRLQFNSFMLLQDVMENYAKKLTIKLNIDTLKEEDVHNLKRTLTSDEIEGKHPLKFEVYEMAEQIKVDLASRKQKINITTKLLAELEAQDIIFKLN